MLWIKKKDNFLSDWMEAPFSKLRNFYLQTNVKEKDDKYLLEISIPGCNKDDIKLSFEDGYLTIEAEKKQEIDNSNGHYIRKESRYGKCSRSFYVGDVDINAINASYKNGILYVDVPKNDKDDRKLIEIK